MHTPLSVTIFNQRPPQINPPFMSSPLRSTSVDMAISPLEMRSGGLYAAEVRPSSSAGPPISLLEIETHENELVREALLAKKAESFSNALKKIESREMLVDFCKSFCWLFFVISLQGKYCSIHSPCFPLCSLNDDDDHFYQWHSLVGKFSVVSSY